MSESHNVTPVTAMEVYVMLKEIGMPPHLLGYDYTKTALMAVLKDSEKLQYITKADGVYDVVAKAHNTTASRVERAIRHSVEVMCDCCPPSTLYAVFGNAISSNKGKPTNSMFLAGLRNEILARAGIV